MEIRRAFDHLKNAANKLFVVARKNDGVNDGTLVSLAGRLAAAARLLASVAIDDAIAAQRRSNAVNLAIQARTRGDGDVAAQRFDSAIEHYRQAWTHALSGPGRS